MGTKVRWANRNWQFYDDVLSAAQGSSLWETCPLNALRDDPALGAVYREEWLGVTPASSVIPGWTTTQATSGTVTVDTAKGLKVEAGAVTAGQGINLQMNRLAFTIAANKPVWLEASVRFEGMTSLKIQFLFGLAVAGTTLITSNAIGTDEKAAFAAVVTNGVILSNATLSATAGTGTGFTIANNTTFKLGIYATSSAIQYWVNGAVVATLTANIPTAPLSPAIVVQGNATVTPAVYFKNLMVAGFY